MSNYSKSVQTSHWRNDKNQKGNNQCSILKIAFAVRLLIQQFLTSSGGEGIEELNAPNSCKIEHWEQQWIMTYAICSSPVLYAYVSASHHVTTAIVYKWNVMTTKIFSVDMLRLSVGLQYSIKILHLMWTSYDLVNDK